MRKYKRLIRLHPPRRQRAMLRLAVRALREERGGEVVEYALIAGMLVASAVGAISCVGTKVLGRWISLNSSV